MPQSINEGGITLVPDSLDDFLQEAIAKFPGAADTYIRSQLKLVVKDFFRRSLVWRSILGPYTVTTGTPEIDLSSTGSPDSEVITVLDVTNNGCAVPNIGITATTAISFETNRSGFIGHYLDPYDFIKFTVLDKDLTEVYVVAALRPLMPTPDYTLPNWVVDQWYEALMQGLYERIYREPDKPYTNMNLSEQFRKEYRASIVEARVVADKNYTRKPNNWAFPPFAGQRAATGRGRSYG